MIFKILLAVIVAFYSVNASAINIYTDGESIGNGLAEKSCNKQACNQLCLRLGFTGGVCVGDKCKCDNFKKLKQDNRPVVTVPEACNTFICNNMCQLQNQIGGFCLWGSCVCY